MTTRPYVFRLLPVAVILAAASPFWWTGPTPTLRAGDSPPPLPAERAGGTGPDLTSGDITTVAASYSDRTPFTVAAADLRPRIYQPSLTPTKPTAPSADAHNVELLGHIGGASLGVYVQGDYAYIGEGPRLTILDISDPSDPTLVGKTDPLPGVVQNVTVSGSYAYVADKGGGLRVVDVSDPANPSEVGVYVAPADVLGVYVVDSTAYVAAGGSGLRVVNVSDPADPVELGFRVVPGIASGVYVSGTLAHIAGGYFGLRVVDVSSPTNPVEIGFHNTPGYATDVHVSGGTAYVADGPDGGLRAVDVGNPISPVEVGFYDTSGDAYGVYVREGTAYVADGWGGLRVLDVSDPTNPSAVGAHGSAAFDVHISGNTAYLADYGGLHVVDVSNPANLTWVGNCDILGSALGTYIDGSTAYVAAADDGLRVVDVSNPLSPTEVGYEGTPGGDAYDVYVSSATAYVVNGDALWVIDVSDPADPVAVGVGHSPHFGTAVWIAGSIAYVAAGESGLRVVDVSNPAWPTEVAFYETSAMDVYVVDNTVYLAAEYNGLLILDVSNPISPTLVGSHDTPGHAQGVDVSGSIAYVADREGGLRVVGVSDPTNPTELGSYHTPEGPADVYISGDTAYVAAGPGGLRVVDVSNPANPVEVGFYDIPGESEGWRYGANGVQVSDNIAYVAGGDGGLFILYYTGGESTPPATVSISGPTTGGVNAPHTFVATVSPITTTMPITYIWQATGQSPVTHTNERSDSVAFTWHTTGTQAITVTAINISGTVASTHAITIYAPPAAAFSASPLSGAASLTVTFTDQSTGVIDAWSWDFGDGDTSIAQNPTHTYADPGKYTVSLTVNGPGGSDTVTETDYIHATLVALAVSKQADPDLVQAGEELTYTIRVTNTGDVNLHATVTDTLPVHVMLGEASGKTLILPSGAVGITWTPVVPATGGVWTQSVVVTVEVGYTGLLTNVVRVTTEEGAAGTYTKISSLGQPKAAFSASPLSGTVALTVTFTDRSIGDVTAWSWDFGDGGASVLKDPTHTYTAAGNYTVTLTVSGPVGDDTLVRTNYITVTPRPSTPLTGVSIDGPTWGVPNTTYTFTATVSPPDASEPIAYVWSPTPDTGQASPLAGYTWTTAGTKTISVTAENDGGSAADTHIIAIGGTPPPGDAYEEDDTCLQASTISTDGAIQNHTFHDQADEDWIAFQATTGITYVIHIRVPAASPADVIAELYGDCGAVIQPGQDPPFSPDIRIVTEFPTDDVYHLRLLNHAPGVYGPEVAYDVSVRALATTVNPGALVIVAGRLHSDDGRDLQENIQNVTNAVYRLFRAKGYPPERIYYLATDLSIDADGDSIPDVDALANKTNLEYAITQWTADKGLGPERAFTLYMMDHGGSGGTFYLDKPRGEWVTAQELDGWLDQLETDAPGVKTNVIVEACYSGGFISSSSLVRANLRHLLRAVSDYGRVIVASTDAVAPAYASPDGAWFSDAFLDGLAQDMSLAEAFDEGANTATQANPAQIAWLDGDGNGVPNEEADYQAAALRGFVFAGTFADDKWPPYVRQFEVRNLDQGQGQIWAEVRDDQGVTGVWAVVYPPSYRPSTSGDELVPSPLPVALFSQGNNQYGVLYPSFDEIGEYRIVIYAQDYEGLQARPKEILVWTGWPVYMPAILRNH
jgi:uncharacterized repeat protein (TIGR01451 family)